MMKTLDQRFEEIITKLEIQNNKVISKEEKDKILSNKIVGYNPAYTFDQIEKAIINEFNLLTLKK